MKSSPVSRPYRMIGARYRAREERRKMLKISAGKLSRIEDPEASLCRSVLINNTLRRLRKETPQQTEKTQPQPEFAQDVPVDDSVDDNLDASMFCVPPTPRLLTSFDEDDLANKRELSCGQASMLDDPMRFHSIITSLETT